MHGEKDLIIELIPFSANVCPLFDELSKWQVMWTRHGMYLQRMTYCNISMYGTIIPSDVLNTYLPVVTQWILEHLLEFKFFSRSILNMFTEQFSDPCRGHVLYLVALLNTIILVDRVWLLVCLRIPFTITSL